MEETNQAPNQSPIQAEVGEIVRVSTTMDFFEAMKKLANGYKITREEWEDETTYGFLKDEKVMICLKGEIHTWTISLGDLTATDWIILSHQVIN
jgi:hypothetical protein